MKTFNVEFHTPEKMKRPEGNYKNLLTSLTKDIGREQLMSRIEVVSAEWAIQSGYYFHVKEPLHFIFTHVSLNEKDFIN